MDKHAFFQIFFFSLLMVIIAGGCTKDHLKPAEYITWMKAHQEELQFSQTAKGFQYQLQYLPVEWLSLKEIETLSPSRNQWRKAMNSYEGSHYFHLKIFKPGIQADLLKDHAVDREGYYQSVSYCSFSMQKDLQLIDGVDTLDCNMFHFERTYGTRPFLSFMLAFDTIDTPINHHKYLRFTDPLFSRQEITIPLTHDLFENTPKIAL